MHHELLLNHYDVSVSDEIIREKAAPFMKDTKKSTSWQSRGIALSGSGSLPIPIRPVEPSRGKGGAKPSVTDSNIDDVGVSNSEVEDEWLEVKQKRAKGSNVGFRSGHPHPSTPTTPPPSSSYPSSSSHPSSSSSSTKKDTKPRSRSPSPTAAKDLDVVKTRRSTREGDSEISNPTSQPSSKGMKPKCRCFISDYILVLFIICYYFFISLLIITSDSSPCHSIIRPSWTSNRNSSPVCCSCSKKNCSCFCRTLPLIYRHWRANARSFRCSCREREGLKDPLNEQLSSWSLYGSRSLYGVQGCRLEW